jgi:hypothetical protein
MAAWLEKLRGDMSLDKLIEKIGRLKERATTLAYTNHHNKLR